MNKPIKRHDALKPLSREHHQVLLLCWKLREGIKYQIAPGRMKAYVNWFKATWLYSHFEAEEEYIFPVLGEDNPDVKRALTDHSRLKTLFDDPDEDIKVLQLIEEELEGHIRFEERVLFNKIQDVASERQLQEIEQRHVAVPFSDDQWNDHFWLEKK